MTAETLVHAASHRLATHRFGLWLFIISESFLFSALLSSRYFVLGLHRAPELNQTLGLLITTILLFSSLSAYRAEMFAAAGNQAGFLRNIVFTLLLGALFLVGVGIEWSEAFRHFPPPTAYGTLFFTMTGVHAFHVVSGLLLLFFVYLSGRRGRQYSAQDYWVVEGAAKYWHFVDVAWVFIYPTLYLVG